MPRIRVPDCVPKISDEDAKSSSIMTTDLFADEIPHEIYGKYAPSVYKQCQIISDYVKNNVLNDISDLFTSLGYTFHLEDKEGLFHISKFLMWQLLFDRNQLRRIDHKQHEHIERNFGQCIRVAKDRGCLPLFINEIEIRGWSKAISEIFNGVRGLYESERYNKHVYEIDSLRRECILPDELYLVSYDSSDKCIKLYNVSSRFEHKEDVFKFRVFNHVAEFIVDVIAKTPLGEMKGLMQRSNIFSILDKLANLDGKRNDVLKRISEMGGAYTLHYMLQTLVDNFRYREAETQSSYDVISKLAQNSHSRYVWNAEFGVKYGLYATECLLHFYPDSNKPDEFQFTENISYLMSDWDKKAFYEGLIRLFSPPSDTVMAIPIQITKSEIAYWYNPVMAICRTGFIRGLAQDGLCDSGFSVNVGISLLH